MDRCIDSYIHLPTLIHTLHPAHPIIHSIPAPLSLSRLKGFVQKMIQKEAFRVLTSIKRAVSLLDILPTVPPCWPSLPVRAKPMSDMRATIPRMCAISHASVVNLQAPRAAGKKQRL